MNAWEGVHVSFNKTSAEYKEGDRFTGGAPISTRPGLRAGQVTNKREEDGYGVVRALDPVTGEKKWEFKMADVTASGILTTATDVLFTGGRDYCLLIELIWADDANPLNNVGQSNTHVEKLKSPYAKFDFEAANLDRDRHVYRFTSDAYAIGPRPSCERQAVARVSPPTADEIQARAAAARAEHNPAAFPIPAGWSVVVDPTEVAIDPGESRTVTVDVTAPDTFTGSQPFNVHAFDEHDRLIGGVTLVVES